MSDNTIPAAAWSGHPAAGNILGFTELWVEIAVRKVTALDQIPRKTAGNPTVVPLRSAQDLLPKTKKNNVLVIAANRLLRDLLCDQVAANPEFNLVGSEPAASASVLEMADTAGPLIVLLCLSELSVPKQLLDHIGTLRSASALVRLVLIGMPASEEIFLAAVRAGVAGYVLDDAPMQEVLAAVHLVSQGEAVCPSQLLSALFRSVAAQPEDILSQEISNRLGLSRRERQLVPLIARGLTNKEIASELFLSEQTVKNHLRRMMRKAGAPNRFAVVERCRIAATAGM
ncbi:MAG TPA: response regulator transcription factor [Patescibacteria group bacterium]|nr:response regulator transcription factor [Patescibacteria group bacterium]